MAPPLMAPPGLTVQVSNSSNASSVAPSTRLSMLKSPSATSPNALKSSSFYSVGVTRQDSLENMARSCASPLPYGSSNALTASHSILDSMPMMPGQASAERVLADARTPSAVAPRANSPLFERPTSGSAATKPARRGSLLQAFSGDSKENQIPDYCEVKVERFGWRRGSFVSRQNSPLLTR